jgi:hypothetical protein
MLDDHAKLRAADTSGFLQKLASLPGSYDGPDGTKPEPYGLVAYGEAAGLPRLLQPWVDAPFVLSGTQFMLASGFDYGEFAPLKLSAEMTGAEVIVLGHAAHEPSLRVAPGALSLYTYAAYLAHATGHADAYTALEQVLAALRERLAPEVPTDQNPAKALAWALWNRVPFLVAGRLSSGLPELLQHAFARVGKTLAITAGEHPLEMLAGAFEARHGLADDIVAVLLGAKDEELALAQEVLETRVAQVEHLDLDLIGPVPDDPVARNLALWYAGMYVAAYVALLHGLDPAESPVYTALIEATQAS